MTGGRDRKSCPFLDECSMKVSENVYLEICKGEYYKCSEYQKRQAKKWRNFLLRRIQSHLKLPREWKRLEEFS